MMECPSNERTGAVRLDRNVKRGLDARRAADWTGPVGHREYEITNAASWQRTKRGPRQRHGEVALSLHPASRDVPETVFDLRPASVESFVSSPGNARNFRKGRASFPPR